MTSLRTVSVIGLGYVGLPLVIAFAKHTNVIAYDNNADLINDLLAGTSSQYPNDNNCLQQDSIIWTNDSDLLKKASFHIITVPTPVLDSRQPDLSFILDATEVLAKKIKQDDVIVFESTVYPGLTEEECIPLLEKISGLKAGVDYFVGYSPERINPGDKEHTLENTIKIVSAQDDSTLDIIKTHYETILENGVYAVSNIRVAEAAKVIENTQRDINIALMNELAIIFNLAGIDTKEVIDAASTKWNFLSFSPGLVGGHCIGIDPYYLTYKAIQLGYSPRVILSGRSINDSMGTYVARMLVKQLIKSGVVVKGVDVTVLGITFKENIPDIRNSRVVDIVKELETYDINVQVYDPYADKDKVYNEYEINIVDLNELKPANGIVLAVRHDEFVEKGWSLIQQLVLPKNAVVYDVGSVLNRNMVPKNIKLLRL